MNTETRIEILSRMKDELTAAASAVWEIKDDCKCIDMPNITLQLRSISLQLIQIKDKILMELDSIRRE